jgi:spermidine synthase
MIQNLAEYFLPIVMMVLPASLLMGGGLPLLDRIAITSSNISGRRVGDIHLSNILGSVAGTLVVSFMLLPTIGTELTLKLLALLNLCFIALILGGKEQPTRKMLTLPVSLIVLLFFLPGQGKFYDRLYETATGTQIIGHESKESVLALGFINESHSPSTLWIGGIQNSYYPTYGEYEQSALTCASASHPKKILIIGLGGANTACFLTQLPDVQSITIVELMDDLGPFLNQYAPVAQRTLQDIRVQYIADDGRRFLYANPEKKYDLIFIDPLYSFTTGHNNLYSREAMELYQSHLNKGGVFCGWFNERHVIPKTAANVFPHVTRFLTWLVAGNEPLHFDLAYLKNASAKYLENSTGLYISTIIEPLNPVAIFDEHVANRECILVNEEDTPILMDTAPWLEYYYFHKPIEQRISCP